MCRSNSMTSTRRQPRANGRVERPPRGRIIERLALSVDGGHPACWQQHRHGARRDESLRAMSAPIAAFSAGVVRINVTFALCL